MDGTRASNIDMEKFFEGMTERTRLFLSDSDLDKIGSTTVAQAGFGGIGGMVIELLARMGVMRFRLLDMDRFDISNINRQVHATTKTLGVWKADAVAARIKDLNPYAEIEMLIKEKANKGNAEKLIKGADVFILGTDSPASVFLFHGTAEKCGVPLVDGHCIAVSGGVVQVFDYRNPRQICGDRPFRLSAFNWLAHRILGQRRDLDTMTDEDLEYMDRDEGFRRTPGASVNFVTNLLGCLVAAQAIKLITGQGKTYLYPKEIRVSPFDLKMKIRSARSFSNILLRMKKRLNGGEIW